MLNKYRLGIAFLCLTIINLTFATPTAVAQSSDVVHITIEGSAPGTDANAMEQAKQDALRRAVEQACGTFITSQTKVKNYEAVYDKAMSLAAGYVTEFDIRQRRTEDGISYCKIHAVVSKASFQKEWARLLHTIDAEGNPRCMVVVVEDNNTHDDNPPKTNGVVQSVLEHFFLDKGVQLMDKGASDATRDRDVSLAAINDEINKLAAMAAAFKADVLVKGVAEAHRAGSTEIGGQTLHKWTATISIRAYHTDSAQLIASNSYSASKSTVHGNAGGDDALRKCATDNAAKILKDIGQSWRKRQNIRRVCQVTLVNCPRPDYKAFEAAIRKVTGVQDVHLKEIVNNVCQVDIDWSYDLERLVTRIESLNVEGTTYIVTEQSHDRVTIKLAK